MEKIKTWWYKLVAHDLWYNYLESREDVKSWVARYNRLQAEKMDLVREDGKIAAEICNMRTSIRTLKQQDPMAASLDSARHHAAQTRIRDLEHQLRRNNIEPQ